MTYSVIHKTTNEIRSGQWDSEYLNFISESGNIGWDEYKYWKPIENAVYVPQIEPNGQVLSIHKKYFFVDVELNGINGQNIRASIPLKLVTYRSQYLILKPPFGSLGFERVSFHGKVYEKDLRVYQLKTELKSTILALKFDKVKDLICQNCLGFEPKRCDCF